MISVLFSTGLKISKAIDIASFFPCYFFVIRGQVFEVRSEGYGSFKLIGKMHVFFLYAFKALSLQETD